MFGDRIKQARSVAGLSLRVLADQVGVSAQAISKYERGLDIPSSGVLLSLANALGVRVEYFFRTRETVLSVPAWRRRSSMSVKTEKAILSCVQEWVERYLEVESLVAIDQEHIRAFVHLRQTVTSLDEAEERANELRARWNIGLDSIDNLTELLEEKGVKVGSFDGPAKFDGCTVLTQDGQPVIVVNKNMPGDRQRFSIAHELGHIVMDPVGEADPEKMANRFAGAFLVSGEMLRRELGQRRKMLSLYELHMLKHKYGVSMQALIYRAKDLGIVSETNATTLFRQFRKNGWCQKEPGCDLPPEEPKRLERLVIRALSEDQISRSRAAELLGKPLADFWREVAERHGGFPADTCN